MEPLPGAIRGVTELANHANVFFVTSPTRRSRTWQYDRAEWLNKYYGEDLGGKVVSTKHKYKIVGDVLVDDKPDHLVAWHEAMADYKDITLPVCWAYPHNLEYEDKFFRIGIWEPLIILAKAGRLTEAWPP
jgi:5'(3')-deoxyribonucleotidase